MKNYHFVNGKCDELLANDIRNQLQTKCGTSDVSYTGLYDVGVKIKVNGGWDRIKRGIQAWYGTRVVVIGDDEIIVMALRSYDTIVGFIYNGYLYQVGKYSRTTTNHIKLFEDLGYSKETIVYKKF